MKPVGAGRTADVWSRGWLWAGVAGTFACPAAGFWLSVATGKGEWVVAGVVATLVVAVGASGIASWILDRDQEQEQG